MSDATDLPSPVGTPAALASERRAARSPVYRAQQHARADYRDIAWLLIKYRMDHGLSQKDLATRAGTTHSQISRMESGRYKTSLDTLLRIARALDLKMVIGFEGTSPDGQTQRQLVAL